MFSISIILTQKCIQFLIDWRLDLLIGNRISIYVDRALILLWEINPKWWGTTTLSAPKPQTHLIRLIYLIQQHTPFTMLLWFIYILCVKIELLIQILSICCVTDLKSLCWMEMVSEMPIPCFVFYVLKSFHVLCLVASHISKVNISTAKGTKNQVLEILSKSKCRGICNQ